MTPMEEIWTVGIALLAGALRMATPFLFVSLGECLTEKSGRLNIGLEGTLVFGAMAAFATSYLTGNPWLGILAAALSGCVMGAIHGLLCALPRVNDIAVGIALMQFGTAAAFFFGKPFIKPEAAHLPDWPLGEWLALEKNASSLTLSPLLVIGLSLAGLMAWAFRHTRYGLIVRIVGDSATAARALGYRVNGVRWLATVAGGALAGIGGAFLSLAYPGIWSEALSSGQGLMAVALVVFARWDPIRCAWASVLFGGAGALGPALQSIGVTQGYYLYNAAPYVLTLAMLVASSSKEQLLRDAPAELSITR
jgi:ABC-type uncharacterized transport system permease subunit